MFWMVMLVLAWLVAMAFGLISITTTRERLLISLDIAKARELLAELRQAGGRLFHR
jgi:hypothetical protein